MDPIDLRSDTVTHPTPEMRQAMANAQLGDDVYGEDPTVNRLEEVAANLVGKERAVFVPSGTMGNLVAILAHCERGDEMILGNLAHTFLFEAGGASALGGVHVHTLPNLPDGTMRLKDIREAIRIDDPHQPRTKLIILENTHNRCGGAVLTAEYARAVSSIAQEHGLHLHIDGARIFNAAIAQGVPPSELTAAADSVTFCLSKGLCAPVGSLLCGTGAFIERARRIRKQLGGGMRQAGVIAAAGLVAIEKMIDRLIEDHIRAARLAHALSSIPGLALSPAPPATNMVYVELDDQISLSATDIADHLEARGVRVGVVGARRFRLVTHYWVDDSDVERAVKTFHAVMAVSLAA